MKKFIKHFCVFAMLVCTLFTITACGAQVKGISVDPEAQFEYFVGDYVDTSAIKVYADYTNDTKTLLTASEVTITGIDTSTAGEKTFTIKYQDYSIDVDYVVKEVDVASISVDTTNMTKEYFVGETFSTEGIVVTALYNNGEMEIITLDEVDFSTVDTETAGTKTLTITYAGKTATVDIVVKAVELEDIFVISADMKTEYFVGETVDTTGLIIKAVYNNGSQITLEHNEVEFSAIDMTTAGTTQLVVTFGEETASVEIVVKAIELESIEVISSGMLTEYGIGDELDITGLIIKAVYNNGSQMTLEHNEVEFSAIDMTTAGTKTVTVTYQGKTTTFEVFVTEDAFVSIEVETELMKTEYYAGDELDTTGLVVKAVYQSGEKRAVSLNLVTFSSVDLTTAGTKTLTVTYNKKSEDITLTVVPLAVTEIAIDATNMKVSYYQGDELDTTGLVITATYNNGKTETVNNADATFTGVNMQTAGAQTLTVAFGGQSKTVEITVLELVLEDITVDAQSMKTEYYEGDELDTTGLVVKATYNSGKVATLSLSEVLFSTVDMATAGEKTLTVSFGGKSKDITITVIAVEPTGIVVDTTGMKTNYLVGEILDETGLKVSLKYNNQTTTPIELKDVQLSKVDMSEEGEKTLTITYQGYTATAKIFVTAPDTDEWYVVGYELPEFVATYTTNKAEKTNKETEYYDRAQTYKVGTDNEFVFNPIVTALKDPFDDEEVESELKTYRHNFKLYIKTGSTYQELTADLDTYVETIDERNGRIKFAPAAAGKQFKVEAKPYYFQDDFSVSFEFDVVAGYNIYNAKQLSIIDNVQNEQWEEIKQEIGVENLSVNKIIFQNNFVMADSDLPKAFFYQENDEDTKGLLSKYPGIVGSLRDWMSIYYRTLKNGETFEIEGNYYTIDFSKISVVEYFGAEGAINQITHSQLFYFEGEYKAQEITGEAQTVEHVTDITTDSYTMQNFSIIGNANRDEDTTKAGGLILVKANQSKLNATNVLTRSVAITWFPDKFGKMILDKVKSYDAYSSSVYSYKRTDLTITNSELKRSGGPLMIVCQEAADEVPLEYGIVNVDANTKLEAFVTGQEAWFDSMGVAAQVGMITAIDTLIKGYSTQLQNPRTMLKNINGVDQFNCVYTLYDSENIMAASDYTKGYVKIGDFELDMTGNDPVMAAYRANLKNLPTVPPILQCGGVTLFLYTENGVDYSLKQLGAGGFEDPGVETLGQFFSGKYITFVLYAGLAVVLELF